MRCHKLGSTQADYAVPINGVAVAVGLVLLATITSTTAASRLVNRLEPTELLRDE